MSRITTCPHCSTRLSVSQQITDKTLICPRCLAEVDNVRSTSQIQAPQLNTDVKRDLRAASIVLAVLMGLCVLGIALAIWGGMMGSGTMPSDTQAGLLYYSFFALFVLVCIAIARGLVRRGRIGVLGGILLVLGTIASVVIFFFFACMIAVSRMGSLH